MQRASACAARRLLHSRTSIRLYSAQPGISSDNSDPTPSQSEVAELPNIFQNGHSSASGLSTASDDVERAPSSISTTSKPAITPNDITRAISQCAHPTNGSTALLSALLSLHPDPNTTTYHAALRSLAVHPSPFVLRHILSQMQARWITLTPFGHHDVAVCLIRNDQLEEGLEYIEDMERNGIDVKAWLYDMALFALVNRGDLDEATRLLRHRISTDAGGDISVNAYYLLFDAACEQLHHPSISLIWARQVHANAEAVKPSAGHCLAALRTAARAGDIHLAEQAIRLLNKRGVVLGVTHYELLLDAHVTVMASFGRVEAKTEAARNSVRILEKSVRILVAMGKAGLNVTRNSTRNFLTCLTKDERRLEVVQRCFESTQNGGTKVPVAAVDTLMEAYVYYAELSGPVDTSRAKVWLEKALAQYRNLRPLTGDPPSIYTFNILFNGCAVVRDAKSEAMYLARDMVGLQMRPNAVTYDRLVLVCLRGASENRASSPDAGSKQDDDDEYSYEDAFRYLKEMEGKGWIPRAGTLKEMVEACARAGDERAWTLLEKMRQAGMEVGEVRAWLHEMWEQ